MRESTVQAKLIALYQRNGYARLMSAERRSRENHKYKKGDEVRFVAATRKELADIVRLLRDAGFKPGKPFAKAKQLALPLYGREQVARFLKMIDEA